MNEEKLSLIWSDDDSRETFSSVNFIEDLKLNTVIDINTFIPLTKKRLNICDFLTLNKNTVKKRNDLFSDLLKNRNIIPRLKELTVKLRDLCDINTVKMKVDSSLEHNLYSIKELGIYIDLIKGYNNLFHNVAFKSDSLIRFSSRINEICLSDEFVSLCEETEKLDNRVNNIKSITIGLNLDSQLRPTEAGIISLNEESFISGDIIDKILRLDFKDNPYSCLVPLEPIEKGLNNSEKAAIKLSVNSTLSSMLSRSFISWKESIKRFNSERSKWLNSLFYEFCFILGCTDFLLALYDRNLPLCSPDFSEEESITELYNPCLVLNKDEGYIVKNDINFDSSAKIYILTGPNQGGKSIFTNAVGHLYSMLHLGMLLPAKSAKVKLVDNIFTHYPSKLTDRYQQGRFATECAVLSDISKKMTDKSLFLFDESLSSTSNIESTAIASEILAAYLNIGCKGIFTTHLHDLCAMTDELNSDKDAVGKVENLSAVLSDNSNERTFKIVKGRPYGKSFAFDIASQFGLDKNAILNSLINKKQ